MAVFTQKCKVEPIAGGKIPKEVLGGYATVWISSDSKDRIEDIARDHLFKGGWLIESYGTMLEVTEESIKDDPISIAFFRKAIRLGSTAEIAGFKKR